MSTERIFLKLNNYRSLFEFVNDNYPHVLDEWKSKSAGLAAQTQQTTDAAPPEVNLNGNYRDRIY